MTARRILAMILALTLCFGLVTPAVAFAAEEEPEETVAQTSEQNEEASVTRRRRNRKSPTMRTSWPA